jgi:hypothetical protein
MAPVRLVMAWVLVLGVSGVSFKVTSDILKPDWVFAI